MPQDSWQCAPGRQGGPGEPPGGSFPFGRGPFDPGGPPGPFGGGRFGQGPRAKRGEIRAGILALLKERPLNGYQIMQELERRSHGVWRPSPGSIYPALQQLDDERLVASEESGGGNSYHLTPKGEAWLQKHPRRAAAPWAALADSAAGDFVSLLEHLRSINMTSRQILQLGTGAQKEKATELLRSTRRSLLKILADDQEF